jgi:DNA polymerase sigma
MNIKTNIVIGRKSAEKYEELQKHRKKVITVEEDVTFLKKKRKHEERSDEKKKFKLLFNPPPDEFSENERVKEINNILDEDNMLIDNIQSNLQEIISETTAKEKEIRKEKKTKRDLLSKDFISFAKEKPIVRPQLPKLIPVVVNNYPWLSEKTKSLKGMLKLDSELYDFYEFIKPTEEENALRQRSFEIVRDVVKNNISTEWKVKKFGSFPAQIHLPDSDVDIIILTETQTDPLKILKKLRNKLTDSNIVEYINLIEARVPIVRCTLRETKINIDIR